MQIIEAKKFNNFKRSLDYICDNLFMHFTHNQKSEMVQKIFKK